MQIDRVFFPVYTLGYGKRIAIWTVGCPHHCQGCSNPELWPRDPARDIQPSVLCEALKPYLLQTDGVTITGGDPFFQAEDLLVLLKELHQCVNGDILVYTGYTLSSAYMRLPIIHESLQYIDVLIDGPYILIKNNNIGLMGSENQKVYRLNKQYEHRYEGCERWERNSQLFEKNGVIYSVGIPKKELPE